MWTEGMRLAHDPEGTPIRAADVTLGSAVHVIPEALAALGHDEGYLEEKAKAIVLLMRLLPEDLIETPEKADWSYDGIVAYSKVCTHVGCPVALYEQQTHHLLCPCHQSQFDVTDQRGGHLRSGRSSPAAASDHGRRRGLPRRPQRLHRTRRPELLGAPLSTATAPADTPDAEKRDKPLGRPLHRRDRELHRRAHQPLRHGQRARPQDLPRPLVVHARRDRAVELRRRPAVGHVPDVLLPGVDGAHALHGRLPPDARRRDVGGAGFVAARSPSTCAAVCSCARSTTGPRSSSSPASACTCCASSSPVRSASRAS